MGFKDKAKAAAGTAAVVAGSVTGAPSPQAQAAEHQKIRNQQRQSTSLNEGSRSNARPTTGQKK